MKFTPGSLVMNAGKNEGQGYVWRVQSYHATNPYQDGDRTPYIHALCIRPLRGKAARMDWRIGMIVCNPAKNYQPFIGQIPPIQMELMLPSNAKSEPTSAALSREVGSTDGLGVAVPPAPTFEQGDKT